MSTPALTPSAFGYTPVRTRQIWYAVAILLTAGIGPFLLWPPLAGRILAVNFLPHIYCYLGKPAMVWTHVAADFLTGLAYLSISGTLAYLVYKGHPDIPFHWMFLAFGLFIVACGCTHFMEVVTIWIPVYVLSGAVKVVTALASVTTAVLLPTTVPKALTLLRAVKAAEQLTEHKIEDLNKEMARQNAELVAANKELDAFCYSVSHDLRTPLRAIDGFSLALLEDCQDKLEPEEKAHLHQVRAATKRMAQLIDDMLSLSHTVRREIVVQRVDLSQLAREITAQLQGSSPERQVTFVIAPGLIAEGDPNLLRIVLENLLGNAWKFTARETEAHIEIGTCQQDGQRAYFVRDNGVGFEMEYSNKLFNAFQRLHDMREFPGTGVGLATVQRIVHRLGGRVWAEAAVGKGATFYLFLEANRSGHRSLGGQVGGRDGNAGRDHSIG
jgi:signal transduction histidine kinase